MVDVVDLVNEIHEDKALEDILLEVEATKKRKAKEDSEDAMTLKRFRVEAGFCENGMLLATIDYGRHKNYDDTQWRDYPLIIPTSPDQEYPPPTPL